VNRDAWFHLEEHSVEREVPPESSMARRPGRPGLAPAVRSGCSSKVKSRLRPARWQQREGARILEHEA
jgi:hypothetical protein